MRITYVTGASGSGKTTLHETLLTTAAPDDGSFMATELDDIGAPLPATADTPWLQWRATEFLHAATERQEGGDPGHLVVTGIVWPFTVVQSAQWKPAMASGLEVRFLFLDRPWSEIAATLAARYADWSNAEDAAEQLDNNRRLQRLLGVQTRALRYGNCAPSLDAARHLVTVDTDW